MSLRLSLIIIITQSCLLLIDLVSPTVEEQWTSSLLPATNRYPNSRSKSSPDMNINEIPRLPVWRGSYGDEQRHIDFTQLFELMGEPRGSRGRELSELISRPRPKCNRRIRILNGVTRIKERGSLARFMCSHGFTLIGPTTLVCLRDRWSENPPICVKSGCRPLRMPEHGDMRQSIGGAVAAFYCNGNTELLGDPVIFCDGHRWNGTEPICYSENPATTEAFIINEEDRVEMDWDFNLQLSKSTTDLSTSSIPSSGALSDNKPPIEEEEMHNNYNSDARERGQLLFTTTALPAENIRTTQHFLTSDFHSPKNEHPSEQNQTFEPVVESITTAIPLPSSQSDNESTLSFGDFSEYGNVTQENDPFDATQSPSSPTASNNSILPIISPTSLWLNFSTQTPFHGTHSASVSTKAYMTTISGSSSLELETAFRPTINSSNENTSTTPTPDIFPTRRNLRPRPQRPMKRPTKRPYRRRTTTTKTPRRAWLPARRPQRPFFTLKPKTSSSTSTTTIASFRVPGMSSQAGNDYVVAIDKEFSPREHVAPIRPVEITPGMLNINVSRFATVESEENHSGHPSMIGGIVLFVIGLSTFFSGIVLYCWRKNKGIARARPHDIDGRTLSLHDTDANDDFMWLEQNQRHDSVL